MASATGHARANRVSRTGLRRAAAAERVAAARRTQRRRRMLIWGAVVGAVVLVAALIVFLVLRADGTTGSQTTATVGGDLHTITSIGDALYVGGHEAVAVSRDNGATWQQISSLNDADAMGWAVTDDAVLVGGHPGLFRSTDNGGSFTQVTDAAAVPDVHALGGSGNIVYLGSPQVGLLASTDGGRNWQVRNAQAGRSFMGTILVDPNNPNRLVAPDMAGSLTMSTDGGRTFTSLGGPMGAMAATWNPADTAEIIAIGMSGAARSTDGGRRWQDIAVPETSSAVTYAAQDNTIYAAALKGRQAVTYRSTDGGATWQATS